MNATSQNPPFEKFIFFCLVISDKNRGLNFTVTHPIYFCVASWNEDHIAITRWGLSVDIDLQFSGTLVVYLR